MKKTYNNLLSIAFIFCFLFTGVEGSEKRTDPCVVVIFGATGDLTARKLAPAVYNLSLSEYLSENTILVGFGRAENTSESFQEKMGEAIDKFSRSKPRNLDFWEPFSKKIFYHKADLVHDEGFENLQTFLKYIDQHHNTQGNRLYYLATPPSQFAQIIKKLHDHHLIYNESETAWSRVIIEKPFGQDLETAQSLHLDVTNLLNEQQIFLMDHYLGKEGVQQLFSLRFEIPEIEPIWNSDFIDYVEMTLSEEIGIGSRANFWEETGSLRDVFQNHLLQLLTIFAMEQPLTLDADEIRNEKTRLLNAIRPFPLDSLENYIIRGQYEEGEINGTKVPGYKQEDGVLQNSTSETFVAAKLYIDNDRWAGTPFYIRGGKRLPKQATEIVVHFKNLCIQNRKYRLCIRIQPEPCIYLDLEDRYIPILGCNNTVSSPFPEAYERLIYDCLQGDQKLYVDPEEQLAAWRLLTPVLKLWKSQPPESIPSYKAGTWGPSTNLLLEKGHNWSNL